jgi:hypothetical protein
MPIPHPNDVLWEIWLTFRANPWRWSLLVVIVILVSYLEYMERLPKPAMFDIP